MRDARPCLDEPRELPIGQVDRVREHRLWPQPAGTVVDVDVVDRLGKEPRHLGDLARVLRDVRLPVRAGRPGQGRRFAQQVGRARDGEPRRDSVAEPAIVGAVPALDEAGTLGERPRQDRGRIDRRVVRDPVHHHLADDRPDPVRLGRPECGIEARLVDRPVDKRRRRPGRRERAPGGRRDTIGRLDVEPALQREDVPLEPGEQVHPRPEPGVRELRAGARGGRPSPAARPRAADRSQTARAPHALRTRRRMPVDRSRRPRSDHQVRTASRRPRAASGRAREGRMAARQGDPPRQASGHETTRIDDPGREVGRSRAQRFLPRTSSRCAVHSEPPRSIVAELPCQPQVHVMVCAWCLYSSITCLNGSLATAGLTGGRLFKGNSCTRIDTAPCLTGISTF